ncbi:ataxin-3 [Scenedesmus sp. NREL 46B-D3]|nr:ataxin-3 [Scenedesmus sp. NREL 46B-D3]
MLYHEKQVAALCGVHCINTLLQGPYFNELDLAQIGHELDQLERQMLDSEAQAAAGPSSNLDESGMFSIQVLTKALQVWQLTLTPTDNQELREAGFDAQREQAFICNLQEHWFAIRQVDGEWWNFNSLYPAPEHLSAFYLTAYLDSLKEQGYTIFVVRGQLPASPAATGAELDGPGQWWNPDEARAAHKDAQGSRQMGRARNAMEDAFARAAAGGGAILLRSANKRPAAAQPEEDEDSDLAAAIAASMQDYSVGGAGPSNANTSSGGAGPSQAAAAHQAADAAADDVGLAQQFGVADAGAAGGDFGFEDDDPELAAALAASLEDHQQSQQQQGQQDHHEQEQQEQQAAVQIPEEPAEGAEGGFTIAFRLPSGGRLSRRFNSSDCVAVLQAWVAQQLLQGGEMRQGQAVVLSTQFPKKQLQAEQELCAAGVEDRSMLSVQIS